MVKLCIISLLPFAASLRCDYATLEMIASFFFTRRVQEEEMKKGELEADTDKLMREYRTQLDSERAL